MQTISFNLDKNIIAVYCLWNKEERIYIGRTINLKNRLHQHRKDSEDDAFDWKLNVTNITYFNCNNVADSDIIETYLINKYKPIYNKDKMYGQSSTLQIKLPDELKVDTIYRTRGNFKRTCELLLNNEIDIESASNMFPLIKEVVEYLELTDLKRLGYNTTKIRNELNNKKYNSTLDEQIRKQFTTGNFYSSKDVKIYLDRLYKELGITKTAKANDIESVFNIKFSKKKLEGKTVQGYQL